MFEQFECANRDAGDEASGLYKSFCGKLGGMVLRLALVSELSRWAFSGGAEPRSISATTIASVAEFVDEFNGPSSDGNHGHRLFEHESPAGAEGELADPRRSQLIERLWCFAHSGVRHSERVRDGILWRQWNTRWELCGHASDREHAVE